MRVLSLFDGIGGALLALRKAGLDFDEYLAVENNSDIRAVLDNLVPAVRRPAHDVHDIAAAHSVGKIDLMVAGFPCQTFSKNGKREGLRGENGSLYETMLRWRDIVKPDRFVFENVVPSAAVAGRLNAVIGCGYRRFNSVHYGAQHRERAIWSDCDISPVNFPSSAKIADVLSAATTTRQYDFHPLYPQGNHVRIVGCVKYFQNYNPDARGKYLRLVDSGRRVVAGTTEWVLDPAGKLGACRTRNLWRVAIAPRRCRALSVAEFAAFQNLPARFIASAQKHITKTKLETAIGNGFDIAVFADIFRQVIVGSAPPPRNLFCNPARCDTMKKKELKNV